VWDRESPVREGIGQDRNGRSLDATAPDWRTLLGCDVPWLGERNGNGNVCLFDGGAAAGKDRGLWSGRTGAGMNRTRGEL
jgi:hypothetical protein